MLRSKAKHRQSKINPEKIPWFALVVTVIFVFFFILGIEEKQKHNVSAMKTPVRLAIKSIKFSLTDRKFVAYQQSVPILMYHHVRNYDEPRDPINTNLSVPTERFREQMAALKNAGYQTITLKNLFNKEIPDKPVIVTFDDGYWDVYDFAYPTMKENNQTGTIFVISGAIGAQGYMNKKEIQTMLDYGFELGSHTVNHPNLDKTIKSGIEYQIKSSKEMLEKEFNRPVRYLCYPSGKYNQKVEEIVQTSGYKAAVTVNFKATSNDLYAMPRVRVNNTDTAESLLKKIEGFKKENDRFVWSY